MFLLSLRIGYQMIIKGDEYAAMAKKQQTSDSVVAATRGRIVDRNFNDLAISATTNTIWVRPATIRGDEDDVESEAELLLKIRQLSEILEMEEDDVEAILRSESKLLRLKKYVDDDKADAVRALKISGIEITEDAKRYYPNGAFLSQVLGMTNDDNEGSGGLELEYNSVLSGLDGRWITSKDNKRNSLAYGVDEYYDAQDGATLWLTIDQTIQKIVTQKLPEAVEKYNADRAMCLIMDPKTGDILAMAQTDDYDPNNPRDPLAGDEERFEMMTDEQKVAYWNKNWRNFCISDVYEPGSTFKLITTSIALENGVTSMNDNSFYCKPMTVADYTLKCWYYPRSHGQESLYEAVENSCNPAMITLAQRLGLKTFYTGIESFGLTEKTGIDFPGEGSNILQGYNTVGLATMSYGQGIAVTPISLVTAIGSIANDGYLMQPRLVKGLLDSDGNIVEEYEPVIKSRTVSEQTASEVLSIMEKVVSEGGGGNAKIPGYRIGGKTGTANKPEAGGYSDTDVFASFIGVAPIEDPQIVILVIVDTPRGVLYGSSTAAPCAHDIMEEVLPYLGVQPDYSEDDLKTLKKGKVTMPSLSGRSAESALGVLGGLGLEVQFSPELTGTEEIEIIDQFPKAGTSVVTGSYVTLYYNVLSETEEAEAE